MDGGRDGGREGGMEEGRAGDSERCLLHQQLTLVVTSEDTIDSLSCCSLTNCW